MTTLASSAASADVSVPGHQKRVVEGWTVHIADGLLAENKDATDKAVLLLDAQLKEIVRRVPAGPVTQLRKVTLWFSPPYPDVKPKAEYHPARAWLVAHARNPAMAKGVEFTNILFFERELQRMPMFVLHELAHAYHDRVLGYDHAEVIDAYERSKASHSYAHVERWNGPGRPRTFERAYAMTNSHEYFAETTEAFFGRNDFYPFTRDQLDKHDPKMSALLGRLWRVTEPLPAAPPLFTAQPMPPQPPMLFALDTRCFYRLSTIWRGDGLSLDIINDGRANNTPVLARTGKYSGQLWKLTPGPDGTYRLTTQWRGTGMSLTSTADDRPLLVETAAAREQLWKLKPEAGGTYRLINQARGDEMSLDIANDGGANNTPVLARTGNYSGQLWKLAVANPCP